MAQPSMSNDGLFEPDVEYALELQHPYSDHVVNGSKIIETRSYEIPPPLLGRNIRVLESDQGTAGSSSLGDDIEEHCESCRIIGTIKISRCWQYRSKEDWGCDASKHLVPIDSAYGWNEKIPKFGWEIIEYQKYDTPIRPQLRRIYRSIFKIVHPSHN